jgi:hypothetical protein
MRATRWIAAGLAALALMAGRPVAAAPRLTLKLENVTFHETLLRLQAFYGWQITGADGAGTDPYQDPPGARRAGFNWREASAGRVFRDVARAFQQMPGQTGEATYLFRPGPVSQTGLSIIRNGVEITLRRIEQNEWRSQMAGQSLVEVSRAVSLSLVFRPLDGDPEVLFGLDRLRAQDDLGNEILPPLRGVVPRLPVREHGSFPDEWPVTLTFPGLAARARRLAWVEGEVVLHRSAETHRAEAPLPLPSSPREWTAGPVRLSAVQVEREGATLRGSYEVSWPKGVEVGSAAASQPGQVAPYARLQGGKLIRLPVAFAAPSSGSTAGNGDQSARMELRPRELPGEPVALVWDVEVKSAPEVRVPFRFTGVPLPLDASGSAAPGKDPALSPSLPSRGLLLFQFRPAGGTRTGSLEVGLARQLPKGRGWGTTRWVTLETDERGEGRLDKIEPGTYRLGLRFRPRDAQGNLGSEVPLKLGSGVIRVVAGKVLRVTVGG